MVARHSPSSTMSSANANTMLDAITRALYRTIRSVPRERALHVAARDALARREVEIPPHEGHTAPEVPRDPSGPCWGLAVIGPERI